MKRTLAATVLTAAAILISSGKSDAQTSAPPDAERDAFSFLVGKWRLAERIDHVKGTSEKGDDIYEFEQSIPGGAISGRWRFNRRTTADPDYTNALYMSGFNNATRVWSFYYVSPQSAQYWPGEKENGTWYFVYETTLEGKPWKQRQFWESAGPDRLHRKFENWDFEAGGWKLVLTSVLERVS